MSDKFNGFYVTLEQEFSEEISNKIEAAIRMIVGVVDVSKNVSDFNSHIALQQARTQLKSKIWECLK